MTLQHIKALPRYYFVTTVIGLGMGIFAVAYWPQEVMFSYQGSTCIGQLHTAPGVISSDSSLFKIESADRQSVGSVAVFAKKVCVAPRSAPQPGDYQVTFSLPGIPFVKKLLTIHVPSHPLASATQLKAPIPVSKKLIIALSSTDNVFTYRLKVADKSTQCSSQQMGITCDIKELGLEQGRSYEAIIDRYFSGQRVSTVLKTQFTTLKAVQITSSSIREGETVYSKPASMTIQFDKPLVELEANLLQDESGEKVSFKQTIKGSEVLITWSEDLPRQRSYKLKVTHAQATDGSMLTDVATMGFKMSGGPVVRAISVGTYKVALGTIATITFDQALAEGQDIAKLIAVTGGAKVIDYSGQTARVSFASVPRCADVGIKISDDLESTYKIKGGSSWQFSTRMICQTVASIGTSVGGRAIVAYIFGSGAKKIVYTGAIHGDEVGTRSLMLRWIDILEAGARSIPSDKTVIIIPAINPDGYALGTRTNAHNVDLNRNFATSDWQQDITTVSNQPFPGGGGASALSEPESSAISNYIASIHPTLVLSYHSIGGLVAANQIGLSTQLAKRYADLSGYSNTTGSSSTFDYSISGTADDYYGQILGVPSILVELGSRTDPQTVKNQQAMWAMLRET